MQIIRESLQGLALGAPQVHQNLALFPLTADDGAAPDYLLLDEALDRKLAQVTEVSSGGSVPELAFENSSAEKILLVDGDELLGAKQNRIINLSILVGGGKKLVIPVSCVEQGRWSYRSRHFGSAKRTLFSKARAKKMQQVSASMRERGDRCSNQSEIWKDVEEKVMFSMPDSPTMSMSDAYDGSVGKLNEYVGAFRAAPGQRGAVVALGEGEDVRLSGGGLAGGALVADGRVVHLATHVVQ